MNLFQRADAYLNLTPSERAVLTTLWSLLQAAAITAVYTVCNLVLTSSHSINWPSVLLVGLSVGVASLADGIRKWITASHDPALISPVQGVPTPTAAINPLVGGINPMTTQQKAIILPPSTNPPSSETL